MTPVVWSQKSPRLSFQRAPVMQRPLCACHLPAFALASRNLQNSPWITPSHRPMAIIDPPTLFVQAANPGAYGPALN
jgi:hypothetical protein